MGSIEKQFTEYQHDVRRMTHLRIELYRGLRDENRLLAEDLLNPLRCFAGRLHQRQSEAVRRDLGIY